MFGEGLANWPATTSAPSAIRTGEILSPAKWCVGYGTKLTGRECEQEHPACVSSEDIAKDQYNRDYSYWSIESNLGSGKLASGVEGGHQLDVSGVVRS